LLEERAIEIETMLRFREQKHIELSEQYPEEFMEFGDFIGGHPNIWHRGTDSFLKVGNFTMFADGSTIILGGHHPYKNCSNFTWPSIFGKLLNDPKTAKNPYRFKSLFPNEKPHLNGAISKGGITIGSDVWIASEAKILSGVSIGDGAVIGASALVTKDIPPYAIAAGVPAKVIKYRFDPETIAKFQKIKWWYWKPEQIFDAIPLLQEENVDALVSYWEENINKTN
jgi:acetyltransferase-like isoleucine patch superfamily enzyme